MHSSTSSFRTLPHGWFSLLAGGALALILLVGWELLWRHRGYVPSVTNSEALWCRERSAVHKDSIVIAGSSRLQVGLDPAILSRALGGRDVRQLAINGANPTPTLEDLASDDSFAGVVILEYMPLRIFTADASSVARTRDFVAACRNMTLVAKVDSAMSRVLEKQFVFMSSELHPVAILSHVQHHHALPHNSYERLRDDRYLALTFSGGGDQGLEQQQRWTPGESQTKVDTRIDVMASAIARIQARGGRVILYRSPVTKLVLADEQARFPSTTWLPRLADRFHVTYIDFATVPALADIEPPDGGHLAAKDVPRATEAVAAELARKLGIADR